MLDIGLSILIIIKLLKIIAGIKIMTIDKLNLPKFLISIVASIMLYWLYIDIPLIHKMTTFQITFNFLSIFIIGGEAIYLLLVSYKIIKTKHNLINIKIFGVSCFIYGFISFCMTTNSENITKFGDICYIGLCLEVVTFLIGLFFLIAAFILEE